MEWGKEDKIKPSYLTPTACGFAGGFVEEGNGSSILVFHQRAVRGERGRVHCAVGIHLALLHLKDGYYESVGILLQITLLAATKHSVALPTVVAQEPWL